MCFSHAMHGTKGRVLGILLPLLIASAPALHVGPNQAELVVPSHNMSGAASSAASPIAVAADVEQDAEPYEKVPRYDDEDERMYPDLVDTVSQEAMENQYQEQPIARARFDDIDDEERQENVDNLVVDEYDGDDMPAIEWNREDPQLAVGTV